MRVTNCLGLPQPIVDAATSDHEYTPKRYSVTQMLKGPREAILARRHADEIVNDVADMAWTVLGSSMHLILERAQETDTQLKENYITADMPNGYTLSGIFDLYDDATGTVTDYKSATVWKAVYGEWDDYREQLLSYVWMLRQIGFDARRGEIVALLKDHSKAKAKFESNYPRHPWCVIGWDFEDWELEDFGERIAAKFREIERCEALPDDELPLCTAAERWATDEKWAVYKDGNKKATRLFGDEGEVERYCAQLAEDTGRKCHVEHRPGEDKKCLGYCDCRPFCNYGRSLED